MFLRMIGALVDFSGRRPWHILIVALVAMAGLWGYASRLELRTELRELLPSDSPAFMAYERQAKRMDGGAQLIVIAESPDRAANERFIDALAAELEAPLRERAACLEACRDEACEAACGPPSLIRTIESGTKEVRRFFDENKWLYASVRELEEADEAIELELALRGGLIDDLDAGEPRGDAAAAPQAGGAKEEEGGLSLDATWDEVQRRLKKIDEFPSGYFATKDGRMVAIRIVSRSAGMGDRNAAKLLDDVTALVSRLGPASFHPAMQVGYAGDIPNAIAEQKSLVSEAVWATVVALALILGGVVFYYRSPWSLLVIGLPTAFGASAGYAFATATYGYVNTVGAFLGAIIVGNGVNYPIVLLSRYRDFRARGMAAEEARREAVLNAFRAELVGASVAAIAYGSLTITQFRGFSQFGTIGFVGMLAVWASIVPLVPATLVAIERVQARLPRWLRDPPLRVSDEGAAGPAARLLARVTARRSLVLLAIAPVVLALAAWKLPAYVQDPWEYNFARLGSKSSQQKGPGIWSRKASEVFGGKMNVAGAMMLADTPEQVPAIKAQILANDAKDPQGRLVAEIATIADVLPGTPEEQRKKIEILERIRERITPRVLRSLTPEERARVEQMTPPEDLRVITPNDLPDLIRRRFEENNGVIGTVFYVKYKNDVSFSNGKNLLRMADTTGNVVLPDGTRVVTASRPTVFAEMIRSMERDGPLATAASFLAVTVVVVLATGSLLGSLSVLSALVLGVLATAVAMAMLDVKINFLNFIALPITFGIGCEYPFNVFDRARLLAGDVSLAVKRSAGPVAMCSYTTVLGYGSLVFADNQALNSFGWVAVSGEIACVATALLFLPALLHVLNRAGRMRGAWKGGLLLRGGSHS
ncbi:RND efflux transporter [Sorangium cellulosum]|uniref:RND efflux transporter n=1 Tax=Sorangium cellulosum TaxID=56 RepID=A0A4P2PV69_SORCE|nr:MMPL family transporter [Sorangium cellulosum]AUX20528.1 RND efflux transporter [Sorangium cellulosum]